MPVAMAVGVGMSPMFMRRKGFQAVHAEALILHLELDGGVADSEPREGLPGICECRGMGAQFRDDHMAAHRDDPAGDGPDMQVVHRGHPVHREHPGPDLLEGEV